MDALPVLTKDLEHTGEWVEKDIDFNNPMNWPCFVHSFDGVKRFVFALDYLWDIWYNRPEFEVREIGAEFGGGKGIFSRIEGTWTDFKNRIIGFQERLNYDVEINEVEVEERWETKVLLQFNVWKEHNVRTTPGSKS